MYIFVQLDFAKHVHCPTFPYIHCMKRDELIHMYGDEPLHIYGYELIHMYGESVIRYIVKFTYIGCDRLYICMLHQMPRERAIICRLRPNSSKNIIRNSCFEAVFDSVWKSELPAHTIYFIYHLDQEMLQ